MKLFEKLRKRKEDVMNPMYKEWLGSILRTLLAGPLSWLVAREFFTEDQAAQLAVLVAGPLAALLWSAWQKLTSRKKLVTAMASGPTTEDEVKATIKGGASADVATASHVVPTIQR